MLSLVSTQTCRDLHLLEGLWRGDNDVTLYTCHLCLCEGLLGGDNGVTLYTCVRFVERRQCDFIHLPLVSV